MCRLDFGDAIPAFLRPPPQGWDEEQLLWPSLGPLLRHVWYLWERALLGSPGLLLSNSPSEASRAALAVTSLIFPLVQDSRTH